MSFSQGNDLPTESAIIRPENNPPTPTAVTTLPTLNNKDQHIWLVFESVLATKNDSDPRLDTDLKNLSSDIRKALFEKYQALPPEERNNKGLIVFLIARDIQSAQDLEFLNKVYQEGPCLSLENCKQTGSDDPHYSGMNQTTLNYPQLAGLYQIEKQLREKPEILKNPELRNGIVTALKHAENFPVPVVQQKAEQIRTRHGL